MPIIVDEVVISVDVGNHVSGGSAAPTSATEDKQVIVEECIERVLDILRERQER